MKEIKLSNVDTELLQEVDFSKGLVPAIIQDFNTGEVLMLAYMNEESKKNC